MKTSELTMNDTEEWEQAEEKKAQGSLDRLLSDTRELSAYLLRRAADHVEAGEANFGSQLLEYVQFLVQAEIRLRAIKEDV